MRCKDLQLVAIKRVITLVFIAGVLPFFSYARAHTQSEWLDDYHKNVGFTYSAQAKIQTAYLWRGLYSGGANIQASANVGYGGLYVDMWWNIGVTDWSFKSFQPEVDFKLGFDRWGLDVFLLYVYNFNCGFFDFTNYPDKGNRLEINLSYTVSSKLPLKFLWATRVYGADGYLNAAGDTIRAWSSYAEISYKQAFPLGFSLYGAVGITPWRSVYSRYQREFSVANVDIRLRKDWVVSDHCGLMLQGQLSINPSALAADINSAQWKPLAPKSQSVNANITFGVYLIK